jgi:hypothetical protein
VNALSERVIDAAARAAFEAQIEIPDGMVLAMPVLMTDQAAVRYRRVVLAVAEVLGVSMDQLEREHDPRTADSKTD